MGQSRRKVVRGQKEPQDCSFPLFLDALLLVATGIHVEVEVIPLITGWKGDGLAKSEAYSVNDTFTPSLTGSHTDCRSAAWGPQKVRRRGEIMELPMVQDPLPNSMAELLRDF